MFRGDFVYFSWFGSSVVEWWQHGWEVKHNFVTYLGIGVAGQQKPLNGFGHEDAGAILNDLKEQ